MDALEHARRTLRLEAAALDVVAGRLDASFVRAVRRLHGVSGRVLVTGVGKSADVARKLVGTLNSTGTRAYELDPVRAMHGDLGMTHPTDAALILSHSGESEELLRLLPSLRSAVDVLVALTGNAQGSLARQCDEAIVYGPVEESDPLKLAPSTSATVMMALGHATAFLLSAWNGFTAEAFAKHHPAGNLGRKLAHVASIMRQGAQVRIASECETVRDVFAHSATTRRSGAVILVDDAGKLTGLFTDSDLARLFAARNDFDRPIREVMTHAPITVRPETKLSEALEILKARKISELPVVDACGVPVGMLDITDVIGIKPEPARLPVRVSA